MSNPCDLWLKQFYGVLPFEQYTLLDRAARTLESNSGGRKVNQFPWSPRRGISPSDNYFYGIWNWDSAFHVMGVCRWDPALAREQVSIFLQLQQQNGMLPDVWRTNGDIFKGCTKPPVFPWACWCLDRTAHDPELAT